MTDINTFIVTGIVQKIENDNKGFSSIDIKSYRKTLKPKEDEFIISLVAWGQTLGNIKVGDFIIAQGYIKTRIVHRKDGSGHFYNTSLIISSVATKLKEETHQQVHVDDENYSDVPF